MAHRRMITSSIFDDEWFGQLEPLEQVIWVGLFAKCADDQGRMKDNAFLLRSAIFPYKETPAQTVEAALAVFTEAGRVNRYSVDGKAYLQLIHWWDHQEPQWAQPSLFPSPEGWQDRIRTRQNGEYIEINWPRKRDVQPTSQQGAQVKGSGERTSRRAHAGRQYPDPNPNPVTSSTTTTAAEEESAVDAYERATGKLVTPMDVDLLGTLQAEYGAQDVIDAIKEAKAGGRWNSGTRYLERILQRWEQEGRGNGQKPTPLPVKKKEPFIPMLGLHPSPGVL